MLTLRQWATPLTVGSFLVMGVTGMLMFFRMNTFLGKVIHEWAGWMMLIGVGAHILLNWRALTTYFKRPLAMWIMSVGAALTLATLLPVGGTNGPPIRSVVMAVAQADEATLMALSGHDLQEGRTLLSEAGVDLQPGQSLADATDGDFGLQSAALSALFASGDDH
ncbi:protein of unknown function [Aliiroseovarius crassostreae]|uniref:Flavinylation-associated cytochrome domain-containing protein n=1 Tax=Aliiroseovarius crassostreae TaxID=154981 RepID=A0A0P7IH26_9RHOB|nr:DUF4405 domain-containing protein [Aliiroseovarius crassostreae]KPN63232.1 hypothetical protein AKJ29_11085 [Aliiroseovarius crassostreae]SFU39889.1 protein of unknown function [Aliiroseovarius crassostreae]